MKPIAKKIILGSVITLSMMQLAEARNLRVLSAWDRNFVFNETMLNPFLESIEKHTDGKITFTVNGPEVVPTYEQFAPVQAGAFDILFAHPGYFSGNAGLGVTIDAINPDPVARRESGVWDYLDKYYQKRGMKLIAMPPQGSNSLLFVVKNQLPQKDKAFSGLKLRANVTYHDLVDQLGGSSVLMSGGDIYPGLQAGLIDGAAWSVVGVTNFKLNEVAGYWTEPSYGQTGEVILMNLNTWNSLPEAEKKTINELAFDFEKSTMTLYNKLNDQEREKMLAANMKPTQFTHDVATKLNGLWADGVWKLGMEKAPQDANDFRQFAASKGMTAAAQP